MFSRGNSKVCLFVLLLALIASVPLIGREAHAASPVYVRGGGDDVLCDGTTDAAYSAGVAPACAFETVQKGIDEVDAAGSVFIGDGTFVEQIEIDKNLSLIGNGPATAIESPPVLTKSFISAAKTNKPIIWVHDADDVVLENFVVDGAGLGNANARFTGVAYHNAGGLIDTLEIRDCSNTPISGAQHGVGIYGVVDDGTPRHIDTFDCTILGYQKNGMAFNGDDLSVEVAANDVTGVGPTAVIAQNGIQVSRGATGIVRDNIVRDNWCTHPTAGCTHEPTATATADGAGGILLYAAGDGVEVRDNTVEDNQYSIWSVASVRVDIIGNEVSGEEGIGIAIWDADQWTIPLGYAEVGTAGVIRNNTVIGMEYGILNRDYDVGGELMSVEAHFNRFAGLSICPAWSDIALNASNNWWGDNDPSAAMDACGSVVAYAPWLELALSATAESPEVGQDVTVVASLTGNSDGEETSAIGFMTDGPGIVFESDRGTFSEPAEPAASLATADYSVTGLLSDGIATAVLSGIDQVGTITITATLDDQTTEMELDIVGAGDFTTEGDTPADDDDGGSGGTVGASGGCGCRVAASENASGLAAFLILEFLFMCLIALRSRLAMKVSRSRRR